MLAYEAKKQEDLENTISNLRHLIFGRFIGNVSEAKKRCSLSLLSKIYGDAQESTIREVMERTSKHAKEIYEKKY